MRDVRARTGDRFRSRRYDGAWRRSPPRLSAEQHWGLWQVREDGILGAVGEEAMVNPGSARPSTCLSGWSPSLRPLSSRGVRSGPDGGGLHGSRLRPSLFTDVTGLYSVARPWHYAMHQLSRSKRLLM